MLLFAALAFVFILDAGNESVAANSEYLGESYSENSPEVKPQEPAQINAQEAAEAEHQSESGHHGPDTSALLFIIIAVLIGAATRHFLKAIPVPFTALLLIIGIGLGVITRIGGFDHWGSLDVTFIAKSFEWAAHIDPHMLFFVFLPVLIFEAAFAMDLHTFKKSATNSVILAVPGMVVAFLLTGAIVYAIDFFNLGLEGWANWSLAFMFGAVISATDPVAVVALLKDLGASKKLGTLIEGESLLNDGTGIVLFMVFLTGIAGMDSDTNGFVSFAKVSFGGIAVGLVVGWLVLKWIKSVFNDAMVEISMVVAAAYLSFFIAEDIFHVSGVLSLVTLGLMVGGYGRSSISPEVEHFMHEFWELAGFIANCIIFLIVGFVIAQRTNFTAGDFLSLGIVYVGVHIVRALVILIHFPFMKNSGYGLTVKDSIVLWYGALRGAIGLALALIVMGVDPNIMSRTLGVTVENAIAIKDQFLFLIAGTVVLTLLVNATTIKLVLIKLGLLEMAPAKALMLKSASEYLRNSTENQMHKLKEDRNLKRANWSAVAEYLPEEFSMVKHLDETDLSLDKIAEHRRRILEKEKSSYWKQFKEGMLGPNSVRTLTETVNDILDDKGAESLSNRTDLEDLWQPPKWLSKLQSWPIIGGITENQFFERLATSYDNAIGFVTAQEECLGLLESMYRAEDPSQRANLELIEQEVNANIISGQTFIRNLRNTYPEIYRTIATRQAIRSMLNYEMHTVERLRSKGRLDGSEASKMTHDIEIRMKRLMERPPSVGLPETKELTESITWLKELDPNVFDRIQTLCQTKIFSYGQTLVKPGKTGQGMYVIARGTVKVLEGSLTIDVVGKGDMIGELSILTGRPGKHRAVAESPVTAIWLSSNSIQRIMSEHPDFVKSLWKHAATRVVANSLLANPQYSDMNPKYIRKLVAAGAVESFEAEENVTLTEQQVLVIIMGSARGVTLNRSYKEGEVLSSVEARFNVPSIAWIHHLHLDE